MSGSDHLFPLKLSDFEFYSFRDDSFEHPMVMVLRIRLEGRVAAAEFQDSIRSALTHHPLLRCRLLRQGRELYWQPTDDTAPPFHCSWHDSADPPEHCPLVRLDLTQETGARFELRISADRCILLAWFHHACVDGIGAIRFLADVFADYGQKTAGYLPHGDCKSRGWRQRRLHGRPELPPRNEEFHAAC